MADICIPENTTCVIDLDCGDGGNPDLGVEVCEAVDQLEDQTGVKADDLSAITLTLGDMLTDEVDSAQEQGKKLNVGPVAMPAMGPVFIRVSDDEDASDTDDVYFSNTVEFGESFTALAANAGEDDFGSKTFIHIFSEDGSKLLQTIEFHTSCSAPLVIGDQYGSVSLEGVAFDTDDGGQVTFGGGGAPGDEGVTYSIKPGLDAALFDVDEKGKVSFIDPPDFENPQDVGRNNNYQVIVLATLDDGTVLEKPVEVCVEKDCIKVEEGTKFVIDLDCGDPAPPDNNDDDDDDDDDDKGGKGAKHDDDDDDDDDGDGDAGGDIGAGDEGVTYRILNGPDSKFFKVDRDTGEVSFKNAPDFENPKDDDGDNTYEIVVRAKRDGGGFEDKPLTICVEDDCIKVEEGTKFVIDLDCGKSPNPDLGKDICVEKERLKDQGIDTDKPTQFTLSLGDELTDEVMSSQGKKLDVGPVLGNDPDGQFFIRVTDDDDPSKSKKVFFSGEVGFGENFTATAANAGEDKFSSNTFVHIFSQEGGQLLQTIEFHTSCSAPLVIGDQYGSISLAGAGLRNKDTDELIELGVGAGTGTGDEGVTYSILGGADADLFNVDTATGEVSFKNPADFSDPKDVGGDNKYEVVIRATRDDGTVEDKPLEICVEDDNGCKQILIEDVFFSAYCIDVLNDTFGSVGDESPWSYFRGKFPINEAGVRPSELTLRLKFNETEVFGPVNSDDIVSIDEDAVVDALVAAGADPAKVTVQITLVGEMVEIRATSGPIIIPELEGKLGASNIPIVPGDNVPAEVIIPVETANGQSLDLTFCFDAAFTHSPIAFDLNMNGRIDATGPTTARERDIDADFSDTILFDVDGNGFKERIEWLDGSGDAFLVDDRSGSIGNELANSGTADIDGTDLFGTSVGFADGFEKLDLLDTDGDGKLTGSELNGLKLWVDDGDAILEQGELEELSEFGIKSISTEVTRTPTDQFGNELLQSTAEGFCDDDPLV